MSSPSNDVRKYAVQVAAECDEEVQHVARDSKKNAKHFEKAVCPRVSNLLAPGAYPGNPRAQSPTIELYGNDQGPFEDRDSDNSPGLRNRNIDKLPHDGGHVSPNTCASKKDHICQYFASRL